MIRVLAPISGGIIMALSLTLADGPVAVLLACVFVVWSLAIMAWRKAS